MNKTAFTFLSILMLVFSLVLTSCTSVKWVSNNDLKLEPSAQIESLVFFDHLEERNGFNKDRQKIAFQIKQNLSQTGIENYGYFCFSYGQKIEWWDITWYSMFVIPTLLGAPDNEEQMKINYEVSIFDSNGDFVKKFTSELRKDAYSGLYYKKADLDKMKSKALNSILEDISYCSDEINSQLHIAGSITADKDSRARQKIQQYFDDLEQNKATAASSQTAWDAAASAYSTPTATISAPTSPTAADFTLKNGTFNCSGSNLKMDLTYGMVSLNEGYSLVATGTYKTQGSRINISFTWATDDWSELRGKTWTYNIQDEKCFTGSGETWVYSGF